MLLQNCEKNGMSKWDVEMQIDKFIRSEIRNLPQSYRDLLTGIAKNCHQAINSHIKPHWSTTLVRYDQIVAQERRNQYFSSTKDMISEKETLKLRLNVYSMHKICFDKAILSCFNEIIKEYKSGDHDRDIDINDNCNLRDIMHKIDLEVKRLRMRLPIYANRHEIQENIQANQIVIVKGQTGTYSTTHKFLMINNQSSLVNLLVIAIIFYKIYSY